MVPIDEEEVRGDAAAAASVLAVRPPGQSDLLPDWAVEQGRLASRDVYRQAERVAAIRTGATTTGVSGVGIEGLRHRVGWLGDAIPALPAKSTASTQPKAPKAPKGPKPKPPKS